MSAVASHVCARARIHQANQTAGRYTSVLLEQLEDGEHDVVDVAEAGRLALLCVMQSAAPVHRDVRRLLVELHRPRCTGRETVRRGVWQDKDPPPP